MLALSTDGTSEKKQDYTCFLLGVPSKPGPMVLGVQRLLNHTANSQMTSLLMLLNEIAMLARRPMENEFFLKLFATSSDMGSDQVLLKEKLSEKKLKVGLFCGKKLILLGTA